MESKKSVKKVKPKKGTINRYDSSVKEEVISLAQQGLTLNQILDKVKPRKRAVLRYLKKANIEVKRS